MSDWTAELGQEAQDTYSIEEIHLAFEREVDSYGQYSLSAEARDEYRDSSQLAKEYLDLIDDDWRNNHADLEAGEIEQVLARKHRRLLDRFGECSDLSIILGEYAESVMEVLDEVE